MCVKLSCWGAVEIEVENLEFAVHTHVIIFVFLFAVCVFGEAASSLDNLPIGQEHSPGCWTG